MAATLRIVFFGTPEFAVPSLRALLASSDPVVEIVCQSDKPVGRGQHVAMPPVKQVALKHGIPILQPAKLRTPEFLEVLRDCSPDMIVVAAYGKILPTAVLDLPVHGCINVHASLLPKYRGAAPIQWAILRDEARTGITIMRMNERMDAGDILLQRTVAIGAEETYGELQTRLADLGALALLDALAQLHDGTLAAHPQREEEMTLAPMIHKEQGRIDWREPAPAIARKVRAFNPWPSAFTRFAGKLLKVHRAHATEEPTSALAGTIMRIDAGIAVATGMGTLILDEIQLEGRKRLSGAEFARGGHVQAGMTLGD